MAKLPLGNSVLRFCLAAVTIVLTSTTLSEAFSSRPTRCSSTSLFSESSNSGGYVEEYDDFANFSSTQLTSSSPTTSSTDTADVTSTVNNEEDNFLSSLQSRLQQVEDNSTRLPLMILDTMLPRQILQIQIQHPTLKALMKHRVNEETPTLGMLGMARLSTGQTVPLKTGVEVEIIQMEKATDSSPDNTSSSTAGGEEEGWDISLRAGRRFSIDGEVDKTEDGWTEARVKFLDSSEEEETEISSAMKGPSSTESIGDRLSVARAIQKCKEFTAPNMNMNGSLSLVDRWIELAKENERHPGQIDVLLKQLGEIPPEHEPTERALWVGALINPLPSMGVATEIRPALLVSKKAEERVQVALEGLLKSIRHMDGSQRLN
mmetsp:Transcript_18699/g.37719  ORF Transcript_18699/g.37719 Transcript_18699/m.37719 type:complete len:376 (-) Transcript_18699:1193-2320(-)